jgi:hypothetical protein
MTPGLVDELRNLGLEVVCLDARHARAALKMQFNKTDQNDAEGLAQIVRTGWYRWWSVMVRPIVSYRPRSKEKVRIEIVTYRWGLPEDTAPLLRLIDALGRDEIDLVAFTSVSQASNLFAVAQYGKEESLKQRLGRTLVASIGPVCRCAPQLAVRVDIKAKPPKLGPLIDAINAALSDRGPLGKSLEFRRKTPAEVVETPPHHLPVPLPSTALPGGAPKRRLYSRLNCDGLS